MPTKTEDDLRELFAPLAADEPSVTEVRALRQRVGSRRARPPRRAIAGVAALTAALATGLAVLPGAPPSDETTRGDSVLRAAAAAAADQPVPRVAGAPLRYAKVKSTFAYVARRDDRIAEHHVEQIRETWVGAKWQGRARTVAGREWNTGDAAIASEVFDEPSGLAEPRDEPFAYGDGPLAELDPATLPQGRDAIVAALREGIRLDRWGPYAESRGREHLPAGPVRDAYTTYAFIGLLVNAWLTPAQRAALLDVLAADPAARDLGTVTDRAGRSGHAVALAYPGQRFTIAFDRRQLRDPRVDDDAVPRRSGRRRPVG